MVLRRLVGSGLLAFAAGSAALMGSAAATSGAAVPVAYVSPTGTGTACSQSQPCQLITAPSVVSDGGEISLLPGGYRSQSLRDTSGRLATFSGNVRVTPVSADVVVHGVDLYAPHLSFIGVRFDGPVLVRPSATYTVFDGVDMDGMGVEANNRPALSIAADHTRLLRSRIHDRLDGDLVFLGLGATSSVTDVVLDGNDLGPASVGPTNGHVDCVQMGTEAHRVRIINNLIHGCSNSALIIKADLGPMDDVLVANNVLRGCAARTSSCAGYYAVYVRVNRSSSYPMTRIRLDHNTIDGGVSYDPETGASLSGNVIGSLFPGQERCGAWLQNNLVGVTGCRRTLARTNLVAVPQYQDYAAGNLRLVHDSPGTSMAGISELPRDLVGEQRPPMASAGAYEDHPVSRP